MCVCVRAARACVCVSFFVCVWFFVVVVVVLGGEMFDDTFLNVNSVRFGVGCFGLAMKCTRLGLT